VKDCFHLNDINKTIVKAIGDLSKMSEVSEKYIMEPTDANGEEIVKIIEKIEKNIMKVKQNLVKMINSVDDQDDLVDVEQSENGYIVE
jgi:hypothetical protein